MEPLITPKEADSYLIGADSWYNLEKKQKEYHILIATGYIQSKWTCEWLDLPEDVKRCCAYYALADHLDLLYSKEPVGNVIEQRDKIGTMETVTKWNSSVQAGPTDYVDDIMGLFCNKVSSTRITRRV
jgi:hypothetical protein